MGAQYVPVINLTVPNASDVETTFHDFVMREDFSCLGARATVAQNAGVLKVFGALGDVAEAGDLARELEEFGKLPESKEARFSSLIAVFPETPEISENDFDALLWQQLQQLRDLDRNLSGDQTISDNPEDPNFSFRFKGVPYFVVGLCPSSSRLARRFSWPTLVFNPHAVFDRLRDEGKYERLKAVIRTREIALQGNLNPNLADFGEASEARQYSGLDHPAEWKCPFHKQG